MVFLTYWFVAFAAIFFAAYRLATPPVFRLLMLVAACIIFQVHFAGAAGVLPIVVLAVLTYACGRIGGPIATMLGVVACAVALIAYKYLIFLAHSALGLVLPDSAVTQATASVSLWLPNAPPLGISFFVFEFCHYLFDVRRGQAAIRSPLRRLAETVAPFIVAKARALGFVK